MRGAPADGYDDISEGWITFAHQLRFALERADARPTPDAAPAGRVRSGRRRAARRSSAARRGTGRSTRPAVPMDGAARRLGEAARLHGLDDLPRFGGRSTRRAGATGGSTWSADAALLAALAVSAAYPGRLGALAPRSFFDEFPGAGRHWTAALPAYSEHLVTDVGAFYLGFALLLAWAAWRPSRELVVPVCSAFALFSALHLAWHARTWRVGDRRRRAPDRVAGRGAGGLGGRRRARAAR